MYQHCATPQNFNQNRGMHPVSAKLMLHLSTTRKRTVNISQILNDHAKTSWRLDYRYRTKLGFMGMLWQLRAIIAMDEKMSTSTEKRISWPKLEKSVLVNHKFVHKVKLLHRNFKAFERRRVMGKTQTKSFNMLQSLLCSSTNFWRLKNFSPTLHSLRLFPKLKTMLKGHNFRSLGKI